MYDLCNVILESIHYYTHILHMDIRKIKPYLEKKIVKGNTYYQLVRKTRIDGKVKRVWSKYLGTPETIEKVYNGYEEQTSLQLTSFEYGRTAAIPGLLFCFHPSCLKLYRRTSLICHVIWRVEACNIIKCLRIGM